MPQFDPTWYVSQIFWLAVTFALLYALLAKMALPPLLAIMDARQSKVSGDLALAEQLKQQAEEAKLDYERALADARMKAQAAFNEAMANAKTKSDQAYAELDQMIALKLTAAEKRITGQKDHLAALLHPMVLGLTSSIVEKLSGNKPDSATVDRVVAQA